MRKNKHGRRRPPTAESSSDRPPDIILPTEASVGPGPLAGDREEHAAGHRGDRARPVVSQEAAVALKLTENIPVGTYTIELDATGRPFFSFCSTRWLAMLDLDRAAVMSDPSLAFQRVHPDDLAEFVALNTEVMKRGDPFHWRGRIIVGRGTRWVIIESVPRDRPGIGPIWEGVMIDITREVESREALDKSEAIHQRHLRQKLKTSLLAATVTHEISQPLSRLLLRAQLATSDPEAAVAALRSIASDAELVVRIIERVKVLLRSVETEHFPVDLADVVSDSLLQVGWEAEKQCIAIESRSGGGAVWVDGDRTQLQIALTNLIRNAIEAIRDAGSPIRRVTVVLEGSQDDARLIVTDTGPGWTGAERSELPLASTKAGGSGLGLYVVRAIMENHRGVLELRSPPGGGAEAVLAIPRMIPSGRSGPAPSS